MRAPLTRAKTFTTLTPRSPPPPSVLAARMRGGVVSMPHYKHVMPAPHEKNAARTHTLVLNTDCPRCGGSLSDLRVQPEDLLHCLHCFGALEACVRIEDGDKDRTANVVTIGWFQPAGFLTPAGPGCDCVGCEAVIRERDGEVR